MFMVRVGGGEKRREGKACASVCVVVMLSEQQKSVFIVERFVWFLFVCYWV